MSLKLLKIYSLFAIAAVLFCSVLIKNKKTSTEVTSLSQTREAKQNNSRETIPQEIIPTTPLQENTLLETDNQRTTEIINPCVTPIAYTLGNFDSRFIISKKNFLETINDAASLWNEALGKNLFVYDSTGNTSSLKINLVYDERQKKTDDTKLLSAEIENTKQAAEKLQTEYEAMKIDFSTLQETYLNNIEIFNARQKTYNDTVISWNEKGGAPKNEYDTLTLEKESLQKESAKLEQDRATLDAMLVTINAKITKHNDLVLFANKNVAIGNSGANKKFTEGNYNSGTNSITIYQFSDAVKLQRVLAHELGHALGIDHTQNKQSIMYSVNTGTTTTLAKEDMQALNDVCSKK